MSRIARHSKRVLIAIVGGLVVLIGLVLVPYPGPGWLVVISGLAILATEFEFAAIILEKLKTLYGRWELWLRKQPVLVRLLVLSFTGVVVVASVYLVNGFGILNAVFTLNQPWLVSPLFR